VYRSVTCGGNEAPSHRREERELRLGQYPVLCLYFPLSSEGIDLWNRELQLKHNWCYKLIGFSLESVKLSIVSSCNEFF
jgi:hypothetical protein